jgi:hypothetical protein
VRLNTCEVFIDIGADHFDFDGSDASIVRDLAPSVARDMERIDRVGDDIAIEAKVVSRESIRHNVTLRSCECDSRVA